MNSKHKQVYNTIITSL